jgi:hypothetical protein
MKINKIIFLLLFLLLSYSCFASVEIDQVTVGLDGYARAERWVPVVFQLRSLGEAFQGKIQVIKGSTYFEKSLDLGESARKRVELLYYHSNIYEPLAFQILDQKGSVVRQGKLEPRLLNYRDNLVLVISANEYNHQFLNGQENPWGGKTFVVYYKPQNLPTEWMGYSSADGIALGSLSPSQMLPAQWKAVIQYTAAGGVLICSASTDPAVLQDPFIRSHLPAIQPNLDHITNGDFLVSLWIHKTTDPFPALEIPAQFVLPRPGDRKLVALTADSSLVTSSPYYKGSIIYFAFDYSRLPEEIRNLFSTFWNRTVYPSSTSGDPGFSQRFRVKLDDNPKVQKDLYNIPGLKLPDMKWFALFFFIYICAVGPFQYLLLKMMKKSSYLWVSFPAIILLFTIASFGYTKYRQSGNGRITHVAVVEAFPELNQQTTYEVYGAVMSESGTFDFQSNSESSYLRKTVIQSYNYQPEPFVLSEDLPRRLVGESLKRWSFRAFDVYDAQPCSVQVDVNFSIRSDGLTGRIVNRSDYDIEESFFLYDSLNAANLGTLKSKSERSFTLGLKNDRYPPIAEKMLRDLLHLYSASYSNPHFYFGKVRTFPRELVINGKERKSESTVYIAIYVDSPNAIILAPFTITGTY